MEDMQRALATIGVVCLAILTAMVLVVGIAALLHPWGEDHQGGRYDIGAAIIVAFVWLGDQYLKLARRFRP